MSDSEHTEPAIITGTADQFINGKNGVPLFHETYNPEIHVSNLLNRVSSDKTCVSNILNKVSANTPEDDSLSLPDRMEAEAEEFRKCMDIHNARGSYGSAAVADAAWRKLREYAAELRESSAENTNKEHLT
jgi:hypothetical protein